MANYFGKDMGCLLIIGVDFYSLASGSIIKQIFNILLQIFSLAMMQ